jgi:hypothetical protein
LFLEEMDVILILALVLLIIFIGALFYAKKNNQPSMEKKISYFIS